MDKRVFRYNGKIYSEAYYTDDTKHYDGDLSDLLYAIEKDNPNIYREETITLRFIGNEYYGDENDTSDEDVVDNLLDCGYDESIDLADVTEEVKHNG